jgi:hypothetical protein
MNLLSPEAACRYFAGALLLLGGVVFTLMALAALHSGADIRNARASASAAEPWTWASLNMAAQRSQSGDIRLD